jgi:hypothetical protein
MENKPNVQKRRYERPAMRVYELKQRARLLVGSGNGGLDPLSPFNPGSNPLNP